jgi:hypothetical protein
MEEVVSESKNQCSSAVNALQVLGAVVAAIIVLSAFVYFACMKTVAVEEGWAVVLIDKPYLFGREGVRPEAIKTGTVTVWKSTKVVSINMGQLQSNFRTDYVRAKDLGREPRSYHGDDFDVSVDIRAQITDPINYAQDSSKDWFVGNMDSTFRDRVVQEYAAYTRAQINDFPSFSKKMNASLLQGFNEELRKAGVPVTVLDVRVKPQPEVL